MTFRLARLTMGIATATLAPISAAHVRAGLGVCSEGSVFVIIVGVDAADSIWVSRTAASDTRLLAERLSYVGASRKQIDSLRRLGITPIAKRLDSAMIALKDTTKYACASGSLQMAVLSGEQATFPALRSAFEAVIRKARAKDTFIFSFGGVSRSVGGPNGTEHYLALGGIKRFLDDAELRQKGVSGPQLRQWLDNIAALRQLILLEAGDMREFLPEFVASIVESRPTAAQLTRRDRIVFAPRAFGIEGKYGAEATGALAYLISVADHSILDLFSPGTRTAAEADFRRSADAITQHDEYLRVFYERDFLDLYARVAANQGRSRGVDEGAAPETVQTPAPHGRHLALLVASDHYDASTQWRPLTNPVNDVRTIGSDLANNFGFDTTILVDPTLDQILAKLLALKKLAYGPEDELLIFFAGHGLYDEGMGMGYLVARNSKPRAEDPFLNQTYLPHNMLENMVAGIQSKHTLLVIDACFGGTFSDPLKGGGSRSDLYEDVDRNTLIARKLEHRSRVYLTSGGKEYVPDGRPGAHSPFARRFIEALREASSSNTVLTMAKLRAQVEALKPEPRSGEFGDNEPGGDFLFIPTARPKTVSGH